MNKCTVILNKNLPHFTTWMTIILVMESTHFSVLSCCKTIRSITLIKTANQNHTEKKVY